MYSNTFDILSHQPSLEFYTLAMVGSEKYMDIVEHYVSREKKNINKSKAKAKGTIRVVSHMGGCTTNLIVM